MENKINLAAILKDCPRGMELDCSIHTRPVIFNCVKMESDYPIRISSKDGFSHSFTYWGSLYNCEDAKCVIFPKGKTTWEGFVPPCKFKEGDILATDLGSIFMLKEPNENVFYYSCYVALTDASHIITSRTQFCDKSRCRLATEEEKQKLFKAIKANGYKWNAETKTLDKLIEPSFKVGDKVRHKNNHGVVFTITSIEEDSYVCGAKAAFWFDDQDDYELVPNKFDITTLKPFESRVLVRDDDNIEWMGDFYMYHNGDAVIVTGGLPYQQCIPYENNEHLLGKTDDCSSYYKTWE